jgi:hypothetical protein
MEEEGGIRVARLTMLVVVLRAGVRRRACCVLGTGMCDGGRPEMA